MGRRISKIISILVVTAFISTTVNLNYISSYISSNKDALRAMSAAKNAAADMQQLFFEDLYVVKSSSAGKTVELFTEQLAALKQMQKYPELKSPVRRLIDSLIVWVEESISPQKAEHISQTIEQKKRIGEIEALLGEIELDIKTPGAGELPEREIIADYHGEINLFLKYVADAISEKIGKKVELDHEIFPKKSLREQLDAQSIDITQIDITKKN